MRFFLVVTAMTVFVPFGYTQTADSIVRYFDKDWNAVYVPSEATYFRTVAKEGEMFLVRDYFAATRSLQMEATCKSVEPDLFRSGKTTWYYKNGTVKKEGLYEENKPAGLFREYYENGSPRSEIFYAREKKDVHYQHWSPEGAPLLINGSGFVTAPMTTIPGVSVVEIVDSLMISSFSVSPDNDTVYAVCDVAAEYVGGLKRLSEDLRHVLVYPKPARKMGIEGKVFVGFIVDKDGSAKDITVVEGLSRELDDEALRAVRSLGKWVPGRHKGKNVKTRFVQPVSFRLQ